MYPHFEEESALIDRGYLPIVGLDEVGRGPLAGPVVAGAVMLLEPSVPKWLSKVRDSKALTAKQREYIFQIVNESTTAWSVGIVSPRDVENMGIVAATKYAMLLALQHLPLAASFLLIDALPLPESNLPFKSIIKGDQTCASIAAASVMAKVTRDKIMLEEDKKYPQYHFAKHKGYPTKNHMEQLKRFGPSPIHRRSFAPVKLHINYDETSDTRIHDINPPILLM